MKHLAVWAMSIGVTSVSCGDRSPPEVTSAELGGTCSTVPGPPSHFAQDVGLPLNVVNGNYQVTLPTRYLTLTRNSTIAPTDADNGGWGISWDVELLAQTPNANGPRYGLLRPEGVTVPYSAKTAGGPVTSDWFDRTFVVASGANYQLKDHQGNIAQFEPVLWTGYAPVVCSNPPPIATYTQSGTLAGKTAASLSIMTDMVGTTGTVTTTGASWIRLTYPSAVSKSSVRVGGGSIGGTNTAALVNGAVLQSSTNGTTWTTRATISGVADSGANQFKTFNFTAVSAQYWRLNKGTQIGTSELQLFPADPNCGGYTTTTRTRYMLMQMTSRNGSVIRVTRGADGRVSGLLDPTNQNVATFNWNAGKLMSITDRDGIATSFTYVINAGQYALSTIVQPGTDLMPVMTMTMSYDASNRLTEVLDPTGLLTTYAYDSFGRLGSITTGSFETRMESYSTTGVVLAEYVNGQRGESTRYIVDPAQNCWWMGIENRGGQQTTFLRAATGQNGAGLIVKETDQVTGQWSQVAYNVHGDAISGNDSLSNAWSATYDVTNGNALTYTSTPVYGVAVTATYGYNAQNEVTSITDGATGWHTVFTYDANGNVLTKTDNGVLGWTVTRDAGVQPGTFTRVRVTDWSGDWAETHYTAQGFAYRTVDHAGREVETTQTLAGLVNSVTVKTGGSIVDMVGFTRGFPNGGISGVSSNSSGTSSMTASPTNQTSTHIQNGKTTTVGFQVDELGRPINSGVYNGKPPRATATRNTDGF